MNNIRFEKHLMKCWQGEKTYSRPLATLAGLTVSSGRIRDLCCLCCSMCRCVFLVRCLIFCNKTKRKMKGGYQRTREQTLIKGLKRLELEKEMVQAPSLLTAGAGMEYDDDNDMRICN